MKNLINQFFIAFITILLCTYSVNAQQEIVEYNSESLQNPTFNHKGYASFEEWVDKNYEYPVDAALSHVHGTATIRFVITKNGKVRHIELAESSGNRWLDNAARYVVRSSPKWKPGTIDGNAVSVAHLVAVRFNPTDFVILTTNKRTIRGREGDQ